jgi:hypothetical protein
VVTVEFSPARRANVPILAGIAGPSGSGKTMSALLLAKGLSGGKQFAFIDTESGRALHYADDFDFLHADLAPPFSPERYWEAIRVAAELKPPVIVIDSFSHEHAGEGGVLAAHEAELQRMAGDDFKKREAMKFAAWVKPKAAHKLLIARLLQLRTHLIVCLRAEEKIDLVKNAQTGKLEVVPKRTLAGHVGWIPVCGKDLPYELALSLVVTPDQPGVPHPIKLPEHLKPFVPLDRPLTSEVGEKLAEWAAGAASTSPSPAPAASEPDEAAGLVTLLLAHGRERGKEKEFAELIAKNRADHVGDLPAHVEWLGKQIARCESPAPVDEAVPA